MLVAAVFLAFVVVTNLPKEQSEWFDPPPTTTTEAQPRWGDPDAPPVTMPPATDGVCNDEYDLSGRLVVEGTSLPAYEPLCDLNTIDEG